MERRTPSFSSANERGRGGVANTERCTAVSLDCAMAMVAYSHGNEPTRSATTQKKGAHTACGRPRVDRVEALARWAYWRSRSVVVPALRFSTSALYSSSFM